MSRQKLLVSPKASCHAKSFVSRQKLATPRVSCHAKSFVSRQELVTPKASCHAKSFVSRQKLCYTKSCATASSGAESIFSVGQNWSQMLVPKTRISLSAIRSRGAKTTIPTALVGKKWTHNVVDALSCYWCQELREWKRYFFQHISWVNFSGGKLGVVTGVKSCENEIGIFFNTYIDPE